MAKYYLGVREVHISTRAVWASSEEEAKKLARDGEEVCIEYSHTLDPSSWTIEKADDDDEDPENKTHGEDNK